LKLLTECIAGYMPDFSVAHICSVPAAQMLSSFNNIVIVLPCFGVGIHRHLLA